MGFGRGLMKGLFTLPWDSTVESREWGSPKKCPEKKLFSLPCMKGQGKERVSS